MRYCTRKNETLGIHSYEIDNFFSVKSNAIKGWLGEIFDEMLEDSSKRKCTLLGEVEIGSKTENGIKNFNFSQFVF